MFRKMRRINREISLDEYRVKKNILFTIATVIFFLLWVYIIVLDFFFSGKSYNCKKGFILPNAALLIIAIAAVAAIFLLSTRAEEKIQTIRIKRISVFLFFLQGYIFYNIQFHTLSWDSYVVFGNAQIILSGQTESLDNLYFSIYPNNQLILFLESVLLRINKAVGVLDKDGFMFIVLVQCFLSALTGKLLFEIIEELTGKYRYAVTGWLLYVILIGLSGWNVVIYTDMLGLIFPLSVFRVWMKKKENNRKWLSWLAIFTLSFWGFKMKPTTIIVPIAILLAEISSLVSSINKSRIKQILSECAKWTGIGAACLVISGLLFQACIKSTGLTVDKEKNLGIFHTIMMGLNSESDGVYTHDDVEFSKGIEGKKERTQAQIEVIKERLSDYGFVGLIEHLNRKSLVIFNDGTFAWGNEGGFYDVLYENKNDVICPILKELYYNTGSNYIYFASVEQAVWIFVLFFSVGIIFAEKNKENFVIVLSLVGIVIFTFLFEARARYLILYVPFFVIAAMLGINKTITFINRQYDKGRLLRRKT